MKNTASDTEMMLRVFRGGCALCGKAACGLGVFMPGDAATSRRLGAPPGKTRYIFYAICESCRESPDWLDRVERKLFAELTVH